MENILTFIGSDRLPSRCLTTSIVIILLLQSVIDAERNNNINNNIETMDKIKQRELFSS